MALKKKTWIEAVQDGSINRMPFEKVTELVGFVTPETHKRKTLWSVVLADGGRMDCSTQEQAMILADTQQLLVLAVKKNKKKK